MEKIKNLIRRMPVIGNLAILIFRAFKPPDINFPPYWFDKYLPNKDLTVVQIGSNDGFTFDPLYNFVKKNDQWKALFVEPVPYLFERLKKNYGNEARFKFENVAINQDGESQIFYSVKECAFEQMPNLPSHFDQIGSFYKENVIKLSKGILEGYIDEQEVKCFTLNQLFVNNEIKDLALLHIDAEGYDWKILSQLNLESFNPTLILFEFINLKTSEKKEAINFLKDHYYVISFRIDFLGISKEKIKKKDLQAIKRKGVLVSAI